MIFKNIEEGEACTSRFLYFSINTEIRYYSIGINLFNKGIRFSHDGFQYFNWKEEEKKMKDFGY